MFDNIFLRPSSLEFISVKLIPEFFSLFDDFLF
jgi:hypothetical protein